MKTSASRKLKMLGMILFLLGLLTGFIIMSVKNQRMGLAAHLEGVMNGMFLVVAGVVWDDLNISTVMRQLTYRVLLYGAFGNWFFTLLSAAWGTSKVTPVAGAGFSGTPWQENIIAAGFITIGLAMVFVLTVLIIGLKANKKLVSKQQ